MWLGNYAEQHKDGALIYSLAQEIARFSKSKLGVLGEAANSVGGYIAGAVPLGKIEGKNVIQMLSSPLKAYILMNFEPELNMMLGAAALSTLKKAEMVAVLSSLNLKVLWILLTLFCLLHLLLKLLGRLLIVKGACKHSTPWLKTCRGLSPIWKVLRVIGSTLGLSGFDFDRIEDVRSGIIGNCDFVKMTLLNNEIAFEMDMRFPMRNSEGVERVADIPIYATDMIVRRSSSLQATVDMNPVARMNSEMIHRLGLVSGEIVSLKSEVGEAKVLLIQDDEVADGYLRLAGAHPGTASLGALHCQISVERM